MFGVASKAIYWIPGILSALWEERFELFKSGLASFSLTLNQPKNENLRPEERIHLRHVVLTNAATLRSHKVLFPMLSMNFDPIFIKYLDPLAHYKVGIEEIFELRKHKSSRDRIHRTEKYRPLLAYPVRNSTVFTGYPFSISIRCSVSLWRWVSTI